MALEELGASSISQQYDLAAGIKLQVRSAWLTCQETRRPDSVHPRGHRSGRGELAGRPQPIPPAARHQHQGRATIRKRGCNPRKIQGLRAFSDSYLDAETVCIQSYDNYYSALYDAIQADFELRRAVGDI